MEIGVIIIGCIVILATFLIPDRNIDKKLVDEKYINELIESKIRKEYDDFRVGAEEIIDETLTYSSEKAERNLERLTNEKIESISEYSNTVLREINKNHEETMFLYDMLVQKQKALKNMIAARKQEVANSKKMIDSVESNDTIESDNDVKKKKAAVEEGDNKLSKVDHKVVVQKVSVDGESNSNQKILSMFNMGKTEVEIARELGLGVGEVKLVVGLFETKS